MPETQPPTPTKGRKSRSLGAFLLFLTVLVAILVVLGGEPWQPSVEMTQDQFEWQLYRGNVDTLDMRGQNTVQGQLRTPIPPGNAVRFSVEFPTLEGLSERYQELKAVPGYTPITPDALRKAIEGGWYVPDVVRLLTAHRTETGAALVGEGADPAASSPLEVLQVSVLASSRASWDEARVRGEVSSSTPPFDLPASSGVLHLELSNTRDASSLVALLKDNGARLENRSFDVRAEKGTTWDNASSFFSQVFLIYGPFILVFIVVLLVLRHMRSQSGAGGVMNFGRSRAQLYSKESHTNVTFDDVAGAQEAKDEVREIVEFLKNPSRFTRIGGRIPRGVLLVGSPGCGKTLLAKAIAGEAEVPFFSISGSDFVEMFVGVGASRVRDLFKQARENSPCIIFLDEIDAVGRRRGSGMGGGHDEREQTLNAILVEMDGFGTDEGIILIAATNRPDVLDPALLRPGRFDREVTIELPDVEGREAILGVHLKKVKSGPDVDLSMLARSTPGYSGADLAAIINEAAIRAALNKKDFLSMEDLEEARDKVRYGRQKKSRKLELADREITAYHEAGHAIVASSLEEVDDPHKVTIVPRGRALGATMMLPDKESYHMQRRRMIGQLALLFGGRVAEAEFCGDISAGASDDISRATDLARAMVTELGMSDRVGPVNYAERQGSDFLGTELMRGRTHSEDTAREIDKEVHRLLTDAYSRAEALVKTNRDAIENLAQALLTYETVSGDEIKRLLTGTTIDDLRKGGPPAPAVDANPAVNPAPSSRTALDEQPGTAPGDLAGEAGLSPA